MHCWAELTNLTGIPFVCVCCSFYLLSNLWVIFCQMHLEERSQGCFLIFGEAPMSVEGQIFTSAVFLPILATLAASVSITISLVLILLHFFLIFVFGMILLYLALWNFKSWSYHFHGTEWLPLKSNPFPQIFKRPLSVFSSLGCQLTGQFLRQAFFIYPIQVFFSPSTYSLSLLCLLHLISLFLLSLKCFVKWSVFFSCIIVHFTYMNANLMRTIVFLVSLPIYPTRPQR